MTHALRRLLAGLLAVGRTQLELLALGVEAERRRLVRLWWLASLTMWLAMVAVALAATALLLWVDPPQRATVATCLAAVFAAAAAAAGAACVRARRRPGSSP